MHARFMHLGLRRSFASVAGVHELEFHTVEPQIEEEVGEVGVSEDPPKKEKVKVILY